MRCLKLSLLFLIIPLFLYSQGTLSFLQEFSDGDVIAGGTVNELDGAISGTISPDGKNVYVVSLNDGGVVVFDRAANGMLSLLQEFSDGDVIAGGTVNELEGAFSVTISPDGKNVYVVSGTDDGVVVFDRAANGMLSFLQEFSDGDAIPGGTVDELDLPRSVFVSPDGKNVYVVSFFDAGVTVFDRAADGTLSFLQEFSDGDAIPGGTVNELKGAYSITVSPDGKNVYVVSLLDDGVVVFDRAADGTLSFLQEFSDGDAIPGGNVNELKGAISVTISLDGKNVYVVSLVDAGVVVFDRSANGTLSFLQEFSDGDVIAGGSVNKLEGVASVTVSPDGKNVYVLGQIDDGLIEFHRATDGTLSFLQEFSDGDVITGGTLNEFDRPVSITVSPDGKNVYVVSGSDDGDDSVTVFNRTAADVIPTLSEWALIILGLCFLAIGMAAIRKRKQVFVR